MSEELLTGRVSEFDAHRGLGVIIAADGSRFAFHCTQIGDGTRTIPVGVEVEFSVRAAGLGRWEAAAINQVARRSSSSAT